MASTIEISNEDYRALGDILPGTEQWEEWWKMGTVKDAGNDSTEDRRNPIQLELLIRSPHIEWADYTVGIRDCDEQRRVFELDISWTWQTDSYERADCLSESLARLSGLTKLELRSGQEFTLPHSIGQLEHLESLECSMLVSLPPSIGGLKKLKSLRIKSCTMRHLPEEIGDLVSLEEMTFYETRLCDLPSSVGRLNTLKSLDLSLNHELLDLPDEIGNLVNLERLLLCYSGVKTLPNFDKIVFDKMKMLDLEGSRISSLPEALGQIFPNLEELKLSHTKIQAIPDSIGSIGNLKFLRANSAHITSLPTSIGKLKSLENLNVCFNSKLCDLPHEIGNLSSLEHLNLSGIGVKELPVPIGQLKSLKTMSFRYGSKLCKLPHEIGNLSSLERLDLTNSRVTELPDSIGNLSNLRHLELYGSSITSLPDSLRNLPTGQLHLNVGQCGIPGTTPLMNGHKTDPVAFLLALAHRFRCLGHLETHAIWVGCAPVHHLLARHRSWSRTGFGIRDETTSVCLALELWPRLLEMACSAFAETRDGVRDWDEFVIPKPDAIFQLMSDGRESFLGVLLERSRSARFGMVETREEQFPSCDWHNGSDCGPTPMEIEN